MMDGNICKQCKCQTNHTTNRLVKDSCGHTKCRQCLVRDIDGCTSCLNGAEEEWHVESENEEEESDPIIIVNSECWSNTKQKKTVTVLEVQKEVNAKNSSSEQNSNNSCVGKKRKKKENNIWPLNVQVETGVNGDTYYCTVCKKRFKAKSHVYYHAYCDGSSKPHICEFCDKDFASRSHFEYHMRVHKGYRPFICDVCQASFYQKSKLKRHILKHTGEKKFACPICSAAFNNPSSLRQHSFIHSGQKPHKCSICSKEFRNTSNLKKHEAQHTGARFWCSLCEKSFKDERGRDLHARIHATRAISCPECPRAFHTLKDMRRHLAVHSDNKPYRCTKCLTRFRRKDNLDRHLRNTHPGVNASESFEIVDEPALTPKAIDISQTMQDDVAQDLEKSLLVSLNPLPPIPIENLNKKFTNNFIIEENNKRETVIFGPVKTEKDKNDQELAQDDQRSTEDQDLEAHLSYKILKKKMNPIDLYRQILITGKKSRNKDDKAVPEYIHKKVNYELKTDLFKHKLNAEGNLPPLLIEKINSLQSTEAEKLNNPVMELYKKILIPDYSEKKNCKTDEETKSDCDKIDASKDDGGSSNCADMHWRRRMALNSHL